jgi:hypothetical protein
LGVEREKTQKRVVWIPDILHLYKSLDKSAGLQEKSSEDPGIKITKKYRHQRWVDEWVNIPEFKPWLESDCIIFPMNIELFVHRPFHEFSTISKHVILFPDKTRWLSLGASVLRILEQLPALILYYSLMLKYWKKNERRSKHRC